MTGKQERRGRSRHDAEREPPDPSAWGPWDWIEAGGLAVLLVAAMLAGLYSAAGLAFR